MHTSAKIKVIALDLGGVIFTDGTGAISELLKKDKGYDPKEIWNIISSEGRKKVTRGIITDDEYWAWAKEQLPSNYDIGHIRHAYYDSYVLRKEMVDLLKQFRATGFRIIIFSGNMRERVAYLESKYKFSQYFDEAIYSFDHGCNKPERKFFQILVDRLGCLPEESLLVDDREENLAIAREFGINGICYFDISQFARQLEIFGLKVRISNL